VSNTQYELGHEPDELERLTVQGRALAAPTRALLEAAGLRVGMRVLDLGSGAGDCHSSSLTSWETLARW
jgi:cyclopropane fatty-acyl-phospholipid synthase-like methyltransferase